MTVDGQRKSVDRQFLLARYFIVFRFILEIESEDENEIQDIVEHIVNDDFIEELEQEIVAQDPHLNNLHIENVEVKKEIDHYIPYNFEGTSNYSILCL